MQEHERMELERLISEEYMDPIPIAHIPTTNATAAQTEDEFEIRRRAFFSIK
jgi:hypothetical protein